jgi:hypothetical protein
MSVAKFLVLLTTTRTSAIQRERVVSFPWQQYFRERQTELLQRHEMFTGFHFDGDK